MQFNNKRQHNGVWHAIDQTEKNQEVTIVSCNNTHVQASNMQKYLIGDFMSRYKKASTKVNISNADALKESVVLVGDIDKTMMMKPKVTNEDATPTVPKDSSEDSSEDSTNNGGWQGEDVAQKIVKETVQKTVQPTLNPVEQMVQTIINGSKVTTGETEFPLTFSVVLKFEMEKVFKACKALDIPKETVAKIVAQNIVINTSELHKSIELALNEVIA